MIFNARVAIYNFFDDDILVYAGNFVFLKRQQKGIERAEHEKEEIYILSLQCFESAYQYYWVECLSQT